MKAYLSVLRYFSSWEWGLWLSSLALIGITYILFPSSGGLSLVASLCGATSLIFSAKGNPVGQGLMILFSVLYGIISWGFAYYGEVITYLGMTAPMAVAALIAWLRHPYKGNRAQVEIRPVTKRDLIWMLSLSVVVTVGFYFLLRYFGTANLLPSTISVTTSFMAAYLTYLRSPYFALAYAANDVVLIVLWVMASLENPEYLSVLVCFGVFLVNDLYGFISWRAMARRQREVD